MNYIMLGIDSNNNCITWTSELKDFNGEFAPVAVTDVSVISNLAATDGYGEDGTNNHSALLGLGNDDHTQYYRLDGYRSLTGDMNFGTNDITNVTLINGYTMAHLVNVPIDGYVELETAESNTVYPVGYDFPDGYTAQDGYNAYGFVYDEENRDFELQSPYYQTSEIKPRGHRSDDGYSILVSLGDGYYQKETHSIEWAWEFDGYYVQENWHGFGFFWYGTERRIFNIPYASFGAVFPDSNVDSGLITLDMMFAEDEVVGSTTQNFEIAKLEFKSASGGSTQYSNNTGTIPAEYWINNVGGGTEDNKYTVNAYYDNTNSSLVVDVIRFTDNSGGRDIKIRVACKLQAWINKLSILA